MHNEDTNELTAGERLMLASLPREMPANDLLEERVVRALRREGHFGSNVRHSRLGAAFRIAAAAALFAGGVATGKYLLESDAPRAASVMPAANGTNQKNESNPISVKATETVVAQTEMWL